MTDTQLPVVLVVEDDDLWRRRWSRALDGEVILVCAGTLAEGERLFRETPDIRIIVVDACVDGSGERPDSMPLARRMRETFTGPMIAASSSEIYRRMLLDAGCDHEVSEEEKKAGVPRLVRKLLSVG